MAVQDTEPADQSKAKNAYYLAKCISRSSAVLQVVYGHIRSPATLDVVFGKGTCLELVVLSEDGVVQSLCEQSVFGTIKDLKLLPWNEHCRSSQPLTHGKDLLVLTSDSGKLSFLTFCMESHRFLAVAHTTISPPGNALRDLGQLVAVEPSGRAVAVAAYKDKIAILPASISAGSNIVDKKIIYPREPMVGVAGVEISGKKKRDYSLQGYIWSMAFVLVPYDSKYKDAANIVLTVLIQSGDLLVLVCNPKERTIEMKACYPVYIAHLPGTIEPDSLALINVPSLPGYLILFRCPDVMLLDIRNPWNPHTVSIVSLLKVSSRKFRAGEPKLAEGDEEGCNEAVSALLELTRAGENPGKNDGQGSKAAFNDYQSHELEGPLICAWSWECEFSQEPSLLLGLDTGELFLAKLTKKYSQDVSIAFSDCVYQCSPLKCLLWMKGGFIAALVEMGEGQVLQMKDGTVNCRGLIQNISPIFDFALVDYDNEKQDQMFACSGVGPEGSLRIIRNGISVEKLISTPAIYEGITGTWSVKICRDDAYHAFLVLAFVEETRVLSVGLSFSDVTEHVGFEPSACTLACGLIEDGWVAQICSKQVCVCAPMTSAHPKGIDHPFPLCTSWRPSKSTISLGAVACKKIILALSQPGLLLMLGSRTAASGHLELFEVQQCFFGAELSCISIPQEEEPAPIPVPAAMVGLVEAGSGITLPPGVEIGNVCVVGTHKPSVELISIVPGENFSVLAVGHISFVNTMGTNLSGCVPEDVRLVLFDRPYILSGLRNGMLLRFEWPASSSLAFCPSPSRKGLPLFDSMPTEDVPEKCASTTLSGNNDSWKMNPFSQSRFSEGICHEGKDVSFPILLHLIAVRRVGVSPVSLVPLQASLCADVIALGDRPWLLQTARHNQRIAYTSISFQPSTHATPVKSTYCPKGLLFVADSSLHLVEMEHSKRLNVQRWLLGRTPRKIVYHAESKTLLVMRSDYCDQHGYISDICCVDPLSGTVLSSYKFENGEPPKCMQLWEHGSEHLLLVGTGLTTGRPMLHTGEAERAKGRLLVFRLEPRHTSGSGLTFSSGSSSVGLSESLPAEPLTHSSEVPLTTDADIMMEDHCKDNTRFVEGEGWELTLKCPVQLQGVVLAVAPYLNNYILACAGNTLSCLGFQSESPPRLKRYDTAKTRFVITRIAVHLNRIAIADCRDGILFYSYQEYANKLEQLYCDPGRRLVADCILTDLETALASDRLGNFCALSCASLSEDIPSPERNLVLGCWYHMGEIIMSMRKGSLAYKMPTDDSSKPFNKGSIHAPEFCDSSVVASTLLGSIVVFVRVTREEYELLDAVQSRLALFPLTAPVLGNNHAFFRGRGCPAGVSRVLDGDMLGQFLELTSSQQQSVLADKPRLEGLSPSKSPLEPSRGGIPGEHVLKLLERLYNSFT